MACLGQVLDFRTLKGVLGRKGFM